MLGRNDDLVAASIGGAFNAAFDTGCQRSACESADANGHAVHAGDATPDAASDADPDPGD